MYLGHTKCWLGGCFIAMVWSASVRKSIGYDFTVWVCSVMNPIWFSSFPPFPPLRPSIFLLPSPPFQGHHLPDPSAHNVQRCHTVGGSVREHTRGCEDAPHVTASQTAQEGARHQEDHQPMQTQWVPYMLHWLYMCDYDTILVNIRGLVRLQYTLHFKGIRFNPCP